MRPLVRPLLTLLILGAASPAAAQSSSGGIDLGRLDWLTGCWERRAGQRVTLEMWMPPAGGMMLGASRTVAGERTVEFEQLRLEVRGDTLLYTAVPSGQQEAAFRATSLDSAGFVVDNPTHDFPTRISYRRVGSDSLVARIEGPGPSGRRGIDFPMRRVECIPVARGRRAR